MELLVIQIILETVAAVVCLLGIGFALAGWKKDRKWYIPAFVLMYATAIVWLINGMVEYGMRIWTSMTVTFLLVIVAWFVAKVWYKAAIAEDVPKN